jgi:CheY-like chemotaxis protein
MSIYSNVLPKIDTSGMRCAYRYRKAALSPRSIPQGRRDITTNNVIGINDLSLYKGRFSKEHTMMKVLVVDDNRLLAATIQEILEDDGLDVRSAKDGVDGYSAYLLFKPDIVITDIQMPRENGLEMMGHIRTHDPMIKTIYMSGDIDPYRPFLKEEKRKYPVSFFEKPFSIESLKRVVLEPTTGLLQESGALSSQ